MRALPLAAAGGNSSVARPSAAAPPALLESTRSRQLGGTDSAPRHRLRRLQPRPLAAVALPMPKGGISRRRCGSSPGALQGSCHSRPRRFARARLTRPLPAGARRARGRINASAVHVAPVLTTSARASAASSRRQEPSYECASAPQPLRHARFAAATRSPGAGRCRALPIRMDLGTLRIVGPEPPDHSYVIHHPPPGAQQRGAEGDHAAASSAAPASVRRCRPITTPAAASMCRRSADARADGQQDRHHQAPFRVAPADPLEQDDVDEGRERSARRRGVPGPAATLQRRGCRHPRGSAAAWHRRTDGRAAEQPARPSVVTDPLEARCVPPVSD